MGDTGIWTLSDKNEDMDFFEGMSRTDVELSEEELEMIGKVWSLEDDWELEYTVEGS